MAENESNPSARPIGEVNTTAYSWLVGVLVMLSYAVSFVSRNVWTTAIGSQSTVDELGLTMVAAGGLMTAYYIGYVISNFITGFAVDRFGPKIVLSGATILTGIFTLLIPFFPNYWSIFILRVLAGASSGPLFACVVKYQISWFAPAIRTTALGLMMSGPALGQAIAAAAFAPIINNAGWKAGFTAAGFTCVVVAVCIFLLAKEQGPAATRAQGNKNMSAEEKAAQSKGLRNVILQKSFLIGTITCFLSIGVNQGYITYMTRYLTTNRGFDLVTAGMIFGATSMLGLVASIISGAVADILKSKKLCCYLGAVLTCICFILIMTVANTTVLIIVVGARMITSAFIGNPLNGLQAQAAAGPFAGRAMGFYNGIAQMGSVVFPLVFGLILDATNNDYSVIFISLAVAIAACGVLVAMMTEKKVGVETKAGGASAPSK